MYTISNDDNNVAAIIQCAKFNIAFGFIKIPFDFFKLPKTLTNSFFRQKVLKTI